MQRDVILTEVQSLTKTRVVSDQRHPVRPAGLNVAESNSPEERTAPRVVLFRHAPAPRDSRAKKFALTLARAGYDVIIISTEGPEASPAESRLGPVRIVHVAVTGEHLQANNARLIR